MSSQKRELQKKKREKAIRKANMKRSLRNILIGLAVLLLLVGIGYAIYYNVALITRPIENYSEGLADDGKIEDVTATEYVELCDYSSIEVLYSDYVPTADELQAEIDTILEANKEYTTDSGNFVQLYDRINLDYVGTVDGVAFEGGSTAEGGTEIVVGEAGYIEGFEDQLLGKEIGTSFDIEVTFPEEYGNTELAGKDAVFSITLNGMYILPEFNDEFVSENLSDVALTADAYLEYLKEEGFNESLRAYILTYITEESKVTTYPEAYVKDIMGISKYADEQEFEYMNAYYYSAFGTYLYDSLADYKGAETDMEYEAALRLEAQTLVKNNLVIQAIFEKEGLTVTSDHLASVMESMGVTAESQTEMEETYGKGYIYQQAMKEAVLEYIAANVKVEK